MNKTILFLTLTNINHPFLTIQNSKLNLILKNNFLNKFTKSFLLILN